MKKLIKKIISWFQTEVVDFIQNIIRDIKSIRALFNWIYLFLYVWLVWYGATHYKESIPTALTTTAAIVSAIFAGYVLTKSYEKVNMQGDPNAIKPIPKPPVVSKDEDGASD